MKLISKSLLALGALASMSFAAERSLIGIGIDLPGTALGIGGGGNIPALNGQNFYLNIQPTPQVQVVVGLGYNSNSAETKTGTQTTTISNSALRFVLNPKFIYAAREEIQGTAGVRFAYASNSQETESATTTTVDNSAMSFGLTTGVEYFFNKHFSANGNLEANYDLSTVEKKNSATGNDENYSGLNLQPRITFNWYFN